MSGPLQRQSPAPVGVHPVVARLAAYGWRFIVIAVVGWLILQLLLRVRVVVFPLVAATLLSVALSAPAHRLRRLGWPPLAATWAVFLAFVALVALGGLIAVPALAREFGSLGDTVRDAFRDVERWIVEDSPFDVNRHRLDELEEQAADAISRSFSSGSGLVVTGAILVLEVVAGALLALVLTFFFVKDGEQFQQFALRHLPPERRTLTVRLARRAWSTLGGYLAGSAMLGAVEAVVIGTVLWLSGGSLVAPVMIVTFTAAFVPFVGAIVAGVIAVAVALATSGLTAALIVGAVALAVQQFDNDLLAPLVFGKTLRLHPVVILLAVTAGGALAGIAGAFLAVPLTAVVINVTAELRQEHADGSSETLADGGG